MARRPPKRPANVVQVEQLYDDKSNPSLQDPLFSHAYGSDRPEPKSSSSQPHPLSPGQQSLPEPAKRSTPLTRTREEYRERLANVYEVRRARMVKESARSSAREAEQMWRDELEQRVGQLGIKIRAPERLERRAERFGGGYRSKQKGDYDWFYDLNPKEQARIRSNWMTDDSHAPSPDEIETRIPMRHWVETTRAIDMARAVQTGRHIQKERYGGMSPSALIAGEPYDLGELHHRDEKRAAVHVRKARREGKIGAHHVPKNPHNVRRGIAYKKDGRLDVQFFTDEHGRIHPIRASYETMTAEERKRARLDEEEEKKRRETGKVRYYNRAYGRMEEREYHPDDDDEAF